MANNPVVNSMTFTGSVAQQATIQAQGIAGGLTFLLPNIPPTTNQLLTATAINGNNVFLGWSSAQSLSNIPLTALSNTGASSGDVIQFNGTNWAVSAFVPGSGTVTSVALTAPAEFSVGGSPITGAGTLAITKASQLQNLVWASPDGSSGVPVFRALVAADIPALAYLPAATQLPVTKAFVASQWLDSYTSSSGVFTSSQPNFTDLAGSIATGQIPAATITIAQINSKRGNGTFVQLSDSNTATANGDVVTYDANGNTHDSGTLLSALALAANLPSTFTPVSHEFLTGYDSGTHVFSAGQPAIADLSDGAHIVVDNAAVQIKGAGARGVYINTVSAITNATDIAIWSNVGDSLLQVTDTTADGGLNLGVKASASGGFMQVDATGAISLSAAGGSSLSVAAAGGLVNSSAFKPTQLYDFPGNGAGTAGQVFTSTGTGTAWALGNTYADQTAQNADIGSTPILTPSSAHRYRVSGMTVLTTQDGASSTTPAIQITYNDFNTNTPQTIMLTVTNATDTVGASQQGTWFINASSTAAISYSTTGYASGTPGAMQFALHIVVEALQ